MNVFQVIIFINFVLALLTWHFNLIVSFCVFCGFVLLHRKFEIWNHTEKFAGPKYNFLIGNIFDYKFTHREFLKSLNQHWKKFGFDTFRNWFFLDCYVVLSSYKDVKRVFEQTGEFENFKDFSQVSCLIDDGLLMQKGQHFHLILKYIPQSLLFCPSYDT